MLAPNATEGDGPAHAPAGAGARRGRSRRARAPARLRPAHRTAAAASHRSSQARPPISRKNDSPSIPWCSVKLCRASAGQSPGWWSRKASCACGRTPRAAEPFIIEKCAASRLQPAGGHEHEQGGGRAHRQPHARHQQMAALRGAGRPGAPTQGRARAAASTNTSGARAAPPAASRASAATAMPQAAIIAPFLVHRPANSESDIGSGQHHQQQRRRLARQRDRCSGGPDGRSARQQAREDRGWRPPSGRDPCRPARRAWREGRAAGP